MSNESPALTIRFGEACHRGHVRAENQDNILHAAVPLGQLFLVADGIGGYQGGAIASRLVAEGFHQQLSAYPEDFPPDVALREACVFTNASIRTAAQTGDPAFRRMGSTVVLALIAPARESEGGTAIEALIGHIGDSRAYCVRESGMVKITRDHSAVQPLVDRNLISAEQARHHPQGSVLTRSLGQYEAVELELDAVLLREGEGLLLCSDGLWGYVDESAIVAVATNKALVPQGAADALLELALAAGGQDNIGIEFLRVERS